MAPTLFGGSRTSAIPAFAQFIWINGNYGQGQSVESSALWKTRTAGTFYRITCNADNLGTSRNAQIRKNSASSSLVINMTNTTAGQYNDWVHTVHYALADTYDIQLNGATTLYAMFSFCGVFAADTGTSARYASAEVTWGTVDTFTGFTNSVQTTEANAQHLVRAPATYKNLTVYNSTSVANATIFNSRKNGVNGSMTVTVNASTTGVFEDTTNSDTVVNGDLWCIEKPVTANSGFFGKWGITADHTGTTSEVPIGISPAFNASNQFAAFGCGNTALVTTETQVSLTPGEDGKFSNLRMRLSANTLTGTMVTVFRKNATSGNLTLSFGAGVTGTFEDTTHTDDFKATDLIAWMVTGGTSGTATSGSAAVTFNPLIPQTFKQWEPGDFSTELVSY